MPGRWGLELSTKLNLKSKDVLSDEQTPHRNAVCRYHRSDMLRNIGKGRFRRDLWQSFNVDCQSRFRPTFSNRILGSADLETLVKLRSQGQNLNFVNDLDLPILPTSVGLYEFSRYQILANKTGEPLCHANAQIYHPEQKSQLLVDNDLANVRIYPPDLSEIRFKPAKAKPNDTVLLKFMAFDKSLICTDKLELENKCSRTHHLSLAALDKVNGQDLFLAAPFLEEKGEYMFQLKIPADAKTGEYKVWQVNVGDLGR